MLAATLLPAADAQGAFPGQNGKIAYSYNGDIWTVDPDGTNATQLTSGPASDSEPNWSPDGTQIAFRSDRDSGYHVHVMDADGTDVHRLTNVGPALSPSWSPDGTRIAFARGGHLWTIAADGTDEQRVTPDPSPGSECFHYYDAPVVWSPNGGLLSESGWTDCGEHEYGIHYFLPIATGVSGSGWEEWGEAAADFSPGSHRAVIGTDGETHGLYVMAVDPGGCCINLTPALQAADGYDGNAAWSPDGTTIVFRRDPWDGSPSQVYLIDADGGGNERPLGGPHVGCCFDWQPIPVNTYVRPKGASPQRLSLVPAYTQCTSGNRTHGPPLAFPSCNPPARPSAQLTIGTADSNGAPTKSVSYIRINPVRGNPQTPADEADVRIRTTINDVRLASTGLPDYTGNLEARFTVQITDRNNTPSPGGPGAATVQQFTHAQPFPCAETADTTVGSTCDVDTTVEALVPGAVKEQQRAVWELGQVQVHDGAGNPFLRQGIFVP